MVLNSEPLPIPNTNDPDELEKARDRFKTEIRRLKGKLIVARRTDPRAVHVFGFHMRKNKEALRRINERLSTLHPGGVA